MKIMKSTHLRNQLAPAGTSHTGVDGLCKSERAGWSVGHRIGESRNLYSRTTFTLLLVRRWSRSWSMRLRSRAASAAVYEVRYATRTMLTDSIESFHERQSRPRRNETARTGITG
jgi:hypothetical protein